ncbi:hypothetical protein Agabi119p4_7338 [Agaricus bisporus var. burnettii]|uniref:Uncharacterized protein n=1 Tax=Agaricus bisporus var. burnettii TaxID=192524 RepID=A0A8H7EZF0_AGABI|nr:hypothetical protein Agabi119p4_7338 [Agaricus bisporus var. burnettii]
MPRIARRAAYNAAADSFSLSLVVQHDLHLPSEYDHVVHLDVVARNPLVFTLAGATNGTSATRDQLVSSKTTNYVVEYLRQNAIELGLDHVSDIAISELKQYPSCTFNLTVTFACAKNSDPFELRPVLDTLHLEYTWKTRPIPTNKSVLPSSDFDNRLFFTELTLPLWTLLNQVVSRFVKNGLVRRYPLVFGHLARQFNNEMTYFQPIIMSITRILRRSLDPAFRSQCKHLFKMLERQFNAVFDIDRTMEIPGRKRLRQVDFTEAVFYLAMRLAFKASMKPVEFKGRTHRHIIDAEDQELLETEPPSAAIAVPSPEADLFLEQDEGDARRSFEGPSLFDMLDLPRLGGAFGLTDSSIGALPFDSDSEDDYYIFEVPANYIDDIGLDLDNSDEELSPWSSVADFDDQPREHLPSHDESSQCSNETPGNANFFQVQLGDGIYVDDEPFAKLPTNDRNTPASLLGMILMESHTTQRARSGDTGASRGNLMGHSKERRTQVAREISHIEALTPSMAPDLELPPLDMDDAYMDMDDKKYPAFSQLPIPDDHRCSKTNPTLHSTNHGFDHEDFLEVISEEFFPDEDFDMDSLFDDEDSKLDISQVRCSTVAHLVEEQVEAVDSANEGLILEHETEGSDSESSDEFLISFLPQRMELYQEDRGMIDTNDCFDREIEPDFVELAI